MWKKGSPFKSITSKTMNTIDRSWGALHTLKMNGSWKASPATFPLIKNPHVSEKKRRGGIPSPPFFNLLFTKLLASSSIKDLHWNIRQVARKRLFGQPLDIGLCRIDRNYGRSTNHQVSGLAGIRYATIPICT